MPATEIRAMNTTQTKDKPCTASMRVIWVLRGLCLIVLAIFVCRWLTSCANVGVQYKDEDRTITVKAKAVK